MEKIVTNMISIVFSCASLVTINYLIILQKFDLQDLVITSLILANIFLIPQILYFLVILYLKFPDSQELGDWLTKKIKYRMILVLLGLSVANLLFSYILMFYQYSLLKPFARRLWIIQANMYVSFNSFIYCGQLIQAKQKQNIKIRYSVYLMTIILSLVFLAHTTIFTLQMEYSSEIYLQIVMIIFTVQVWWKQNPVFLYLLILAFELTSVVYALLEIKVYQAHKLIYSLQIFKLICLFMHVIIVIRILINRVRQFIRDTFSFEKKKGGLHPNLINIIQKTHLHYKNSNTSSLQNINATFHNNQNQSNAIKYSEQKVDCSICYIQMVDGCQIYNIPCHHIFHLECLKNWLLIQNSCPSCRELVI